jgi:hypothetical protein
MIATVPSSFWVIALSSLGQVFFASSFARPLRAVVITSAAIANVTPIGVTLACGSRTKYHVRATECATLSVLQTFVDPRAKEFFAPWDAAEGPSDSVFFGCFRRRRHGMDIAEHRKVEELTGGRR